MRARAPGKLVLSGAYSVLHGAPAIVTAVDRFALVDTERPPEHRPAEVEAAVRCGFLTAMPWCDASALRTTGAGGDRKLGLGSSAAMVAAALAAEHGDGDADALFRMAYRAHKSAQGGGSGIDVAASSYGGTLVCQVTEAGLANTPHVLPDVSVEVWACPEAASTPTMLAAVRALHERDPATHDAHMDAAKRGADAAVVARSRPALVEALRAQLSALAALGDAAGVPIVTEETRLADEAAAAEDAVVLPSGAGGGDVAIYVGGSPSSPSFRARAAAAGLSMEEMAIGARGAHRLPLA